MLMGDSGAVEKAPFLFETLSRADSPRYKCLKNETCVGRAILPADFFNSPIVSC
jgi:hypothetical protein